LGTMLNGTLRFWNYPEFQIYWPAPSSARSRHYCAGTSGSAGENAQPAA
jgi:hypothetical protein